LELDERLKRASIDAIERFGTQFSCSRAYLSLGLYEELESLLAQVYGRPTVVAPTTSLGHLSNIPVLVGKNDAVILDHQVHASVQNAVRMVKAGGTHVEMVRHNNMEHLENRIKKLSQKYNKVWYMADGIYSMYGDAAPMADLNRLMDQYEQFYLYVDDAHGMSWTGKNGAGYVLDQIEYHPKMVLITSLAKGFGSCGGAMIFHNEEMKQMVRNCGGTLMFSGPLQPAQLGASIACAKIHLTDEIYTLQNELKSRIQYFVNKANELGLPLVDGSITPVFYIGVGKPEVGYSLCKKMMDLGYYTNIAAFPSVPYNNTGLRMTITRHHSYEDLNNVLNVIAEHLDGVLKEMNYSKSEIFKAFKMNVPTNLRVVAGS
ncbi:MAG: aminotransferase class I/II-fold pyridoxal phosphate-dependent enzyme, partial [Bacteroidota bacterium]